MIADQLNWAGNWRHKVEAVEAFNAAQAPPEGDRWASRAQLFSQLTDALDPTADPWVVALRNAVRPTDSVLDVGAGTGRYTVQVAPSVAWVTAVEPSAGMRVGLERQLAARGLGNVSVVPTPWQEAAVEPHAVAFVAHVLYFVRDAVPFIEKLDRSALRACYLLHRVEPRDVLMAPLRGEIHGVDRPSEPDFLDLYNLLFSMGIRANARLVHEPFRPRYTSVADAMPEARRLLGLSPEDHSHDDRIERFLCEVLVERNGRLGFPHGPQEAIVWWEKGPP